MGRRLVRLALIGLFAAGCGDRLASDVGGPGSPAPQPVATATAISATSVPSAPAPSAVPSPTAAGTPPPTASPTAGPVASGALTLAQLKYRLVDRFGRLWYCDPDRYPVARADQDSLAESRFGEVQRDAETFSAIVAHLGYVPSGTYSHAQKLAIYTDWKMLAALHLDPLAAAYHFAARFTADQQTGSLVDGTVDQRGQISVASQTASGPPPCPICLARGTRIATPSGDIPVEDLRAGMTVWTADERGDRIPAPVTIVGSTTAPVDHQVVHLVLADGREVYASPGHPLADGRLLGAIAVGDLVDGARVTGAERVAYGYGTTFDLLPAGPTGTYWAAGIPLASTLRR
ncbi:MAG TPA: Hint domain-containing protein [Candidatus Limnocylindria bacterium]|nr:Hint domain-containing protein [Candidatus Limnocylindria bacterium]